MFNNLAEQVYADPATTRRAQGPVASPAAQVMENAPGHRTPPALCDVGPVRISRVMSPLSAGFVEFFPPDADRAQTASFLLRLSGKSHLTQLGKTVLLTPGDATLIDNAAPAACHVIEAGMELVLTCPTRILRDHLPSPEWFCGRLLPHARGMNGTIAALVLAFLDAGEQTFAPAHQTRLASHLLDVVSTAYAIAFDEHVASSSIVNRREASIKLFIERNLRDPDLSPCSIASRLKLSSRYLRLIFASSGETVSGYILRRRLEECAKQIVDARWRGHSMTEIAFGWGFNSASHFTRSFRDRFATNPREYRRIHCEGAKEQTLAAV